MSRQHLVKAETEIVLQKNGKYDLKMFIDDEEINRVQHFDTYEDAEAARKIMQDAMVSTLAQLRKM
jgi:hypothetical protein